MNILCVMNDTQKIYKVKIDDTPAKLEFTENSMLCITGETIHFDVQLEGKSLRSFEFQKPNKIALNIYVDSKLKFVRLTSKYAVDINETIASLV